MKIFLDANIIIYLVESVTAVRQAVRLQLFSLASDDAQFLCSALSRIECRVQPIRDRADPLLAAYDGFFAGSEVRMVPIDDAVLDRATVLRAALQFKVPDCIQLASAIESQSDLFVTADKQLSRCPGIAIGTIDIPN